MSARPEILLVEDSEDDVLLIRRAFERAGLKAPYAVKDGEAALAYLSGMGRYSSRHDFPLPTLVVLDLGLPGIDGFQVLRWIREQPSTWSLPVVVLTSSQEPGDMHAAFQLGANSVLVKEVDFADEGELVKFIRKHLARKANSNGDSGHGRGQAG